MTTLPPPPGKTESVRAASTLVVAPHFDDEVLGCGGLLAQLAAQGGVVRVLFLSDSSGEGRESSEASDQDAYRARRREEAGRAAATLGISGFDSLGLPDGSLADHLEVVASGIQRALLAQRPQLLLVPSPLEASSDHRAAFAALHRALSPLREGDELLAALTAASGLAILAYEVNHPGHPDLLVEVTAELPRIEAAMACYASQEEQHPYLAAGLGLRRFRTLTLAPQVAAAEGYRRLSLQDFTTRGLARLVAEVGGAVSAVTAVGEVEMHEGARISVIVRTKDRPALLAQALESLAASSYRRVEVVVVNDGGQPPEIASDFPLPVVRVDLAENRGRAAAANAGVAAASGEYVTFLDDDDLAEPEHLATLVGLVGGAGVRVAYSDAAVGVYEPDGRQGWRCVERRLPYSRDFDPELLLVDNYIPFNTVVFERRLLAEVGQFDDSLPFFEDWDLLIRATARAGFQHLRQVTCEYRHFRGGAHHVFGERPSERPDFLAVKARVLAKHARRLTPELLARVVDRLRGEAVWKGEDASAARRELAGLEERFHALNGELASFKLDHQRLTAEVERRDRELAGLGKERDEQRLELARLGAELTRLFGDEKTLRATVEDQTSHLGRTYAEIERLNAEIAAMKATRAWRLHEWWQHKPK